MFSYLEDIDQSLPLIEQKKAALTRRANKFVEWLHRDFYCVYIDHQSTDELTKLIDRIIDALGASLPQDNWQSLLLEFKEAQQMAFGLSDMQMKETEPNEVANHVKAITSILATLEHYKTQITKL